MPKVNGKVLQTKIDENGRFLAKIQLSGKLPKVGESIMVKWGSTRTTSQNALYWKYLTWLIEDAGLKENGHYSTEALHLDLKSHLLKKGESTTTMNKVEFGEFFDKVNLFIVEFFGIDTSSFFKEYADYIGD